MYAIIDTEGTGLFDYKRPADGEGQPRLAELAMLFVGPDLEVTGEFHAYIKPDGWTMEGEASEVTGLTMDHLEAHGVPVQVALEAYRDAIIRDGRTVVAHNSQHDLKQIRAELRRAGMADMFEDTKNICTMRGLTNICKIPPNSGRGGYKWPKLSEACVHFGFELLGDHTATGDCKACLQLFRKMVELGEVPEAKVHFAKNPPKKEESQ